MANISIQEDKRDLADRIANNGNRTNGYLRPKTQAELVSEAELRYLTARHNLRTFLRTNT